MSLAVGKLYELISNMAKSPIISKAVLTVPDTKVSYMVKGDEESRKIEDMFSEYCGRSIEDYVPSERYLRVLNEMAKGPFAENPTLVGELRSMIYELCPEAFGHIDNLHPVQLLTLCEHFEKLRMVYEETLDIRSLDKDITLVKTQIEKCESEVKRKRQEIEILDRCIQNVRESLTGQADLSECQIERRKMLDNWHRQRNNKSRELKSFSEVLLNLETKKMILEQMCDIMAY